MWQILTKQIALIQTCVILCHYATLKIVFENAFIAYL